MKKILSVFLIISIALSMFCGCSDTDPRIIYNEEDFTYVTFGSYPQSEVSDEDALPLFARINKDTIWTSYDYYSDDERSDFMVYTDVEYNGEMYRAVSFDALRQNACQAISDYEIGEIYWFKFEPIKWRVLKDEDGVQMLICETAIDSQPFNERFYASNGKYYSNSDCIYPVNYYATSYIRDWLNDDFYNTAFSSLEQENIVKMKDDNVYLLSQSEYEKEEYCFDIITSRRDPTDYAMIQGAIKNSDGCFWWLCTADSNTMSRTCCIYTFGYSHTVTCVDASVGVVPVIYIEK